MILSVVNFVGVCPGLGEPGGRHGGLWSAEPGAKCHGNNAVPRRWGTDRCHARSPAGRAGGRGAADRAAIRTGRW